MVTLRTVRPDDLEALYNICLVTGAAGKDASALHHDPQLVGHIYVAPYAVLEPAQTLVAEDEHGVAGYLVGTHNTAAFAEKLRRQWWPALVERYAAPDFVPTEADLQRIAAIREPEVNPAPIVTQYPAHIHMNLLPRLRGKGLGRAMVNQWVAGAEIAGVQGIHLGASASNPDGIAFWTKVGFRPLESIGRTVWFGMTLSR